MLEPSFRPLQYRERWFAYLDLLGFTNLVKTGPIHEVLFVYDEALQRMRTACKLGSEQVGLQNSWFSDTLIIYSRSDSLEDFMRVESAARNFFQLLLIKRIPVRGCISHGKLYSQKKRNVFIGPALIEAYNFGEALDWVGFCLAPSVKEKLNGKLPVDLRAFYREITDKEILRKARADRLYAFAFNNGMVNGRNPFREALQTMRRTAPEEAIKKYDNTLRFLDMTG